MQRIPGYLVANCSIKMPGAAPSSEALEEEEPHQRRQQLINFGHAQWGFNNWSWAVSKQDLDFVDLSCGKYTAGVAAFVSVSLKTVDIHRENVGYGTALGHSKGLAIHRARKCAVTNALRETLLSFGGAVASELLELDAHKELPAAPEPKQQSENNINLANKPSAPPPAPVPAPPAEPLVKNTRKDDCSPPTPTGPPVKNAPVAPPPVAKALPIPANLPPAANRPPAPRAPPPAASAAQHPAAPHPAATHAAATHAAATHAAATHAAATHAAATHAAATHPAAQHPAAQHPAAQHAAATHPAAQHPAAQHPAAQHPAAQHPAAQHPAAQHPAAQHPAPPHPAQPHPHAAHQRPNSNEVRGDSEEARAERKRRQRLAQEEFRLKQLQRQGQEEKQELDSISTSVDNLLMAIPTQEVDAKQTGNTESTTKRKSPVADGGAAKRRAPLSRLDVREP